MTSISTLLKNKYSHGIQISWLLPKLSPSRGNSAERVEGRCDRLHLPTKETKAETLQLLTEQASADNVWNYEWILLPQHAVQLYLLKWQRFVNGANPGSYHGHMHGESVCITVHSHRADAHLLGRAHHAASNLSSIGNQHLLYPSHTWEDTGGTSVTVKWKGCTLWKTTADGVRYYL